MTRANAPLLRERDEASWLIIIERTQRLHSRDGQIFNAESPGCAIPSRLRIAGHEHEPACASDLANDAYGVFLSNDVIHAAQYAHRV